ncbi:NB-ARC domain, LRR domain containing protein [Parasponia andersonii]|uniref:NB-ARC domain, LRR domain containing protein n=1 Tax=Parasponia andersonii TaxID=3476 RepID=A0A2P5DRH0_PARAD|nr:NB-ARC domain, LRR domain containing protein [Parasponia andersonii]
MKPLFRGGVDGSKILMTTRSGKVALLMNCPTISYYLKGLPEDACWSLFIKRAFRRGEEDKNQTLLPIGKEIVKKCGGVALAAKSLGSLMSFKREESEWWFVRDSELWNLNEGQSGILPALRLSYSNLPPALRNCFAFCSIFPRSYEIEKEKLIHLWMAEGLIEYNDNEGSKPGEDIGNDYFNDLLWMSFFQEMKQSDIHCVVTRSYKMHDIIYDLAQFVARSEYPILGHGFPTPSSFKQIRHSSVICDFKSFICDFKSFMIPNKLYEAKGLRTLLVFSGGNIKEAPRELYSHFKYLLVLDLSGSGLVTIDHSIVRLGGLRFLDLSYTPIKELPHEIQNFHALITFNLINCYNLKALPDLRKMKSLRHFNNIGCVALTRMCSSGLFDESIASVRLFARVDTFDTLTSLDGIKTLPLFVIGGPRDMKLLGLLPNLQGSLKVTQLENVQSIENAIMAELKFKKGIESLELHWGSDDRSLNIDPHRESITSSSRKRKESCSSGPPERLEVDPSLAEQVLQHLLPLSNLRRLLIKGYPGYRLPNLVILFLNEVDLINCGKCRYLPTLGNLPFLHSVSLRGMHGVRRISKEFYDEGTERPFPSLRNLVLDDFPNLTEMSSLGGKTAFPILTKLVVSKCPKLTSVPLIFSLKHLVLQDCSAFLVHFFQGLTSLETLSIENVNDMFHFPGEFPSKNRLLMTLDIKSCPRLRSLPSEFGNLVDLKSLTIQWCGDLFNLPQSFQNLTALESLEIGDCYSLKFLADYEIQGLRKLRTLSIENCNNLTSLSLGFQDLTSLDFLSIMYCPSLGALPQGIEHLSALRSLTILSCQELMSLPEGLTKLKVLHSLEIRRCSGLKALPEWIEKLVSLRSLVISDCHNIAFLPEGVKRLTALQHLSIQDCPQLLQRCNEEGGVDWPKIAHVPYKCIGSPDHRRQSEAGTTSSNR